MTLRLPTRLVALSVALATTATAAISSAHGISAENQEAMATGGPLDYIWLGAEHMVTGYDHLLFLFGVIFFLSNFRDIVKFITAFTLGHSITLLGATLLEITANAYLVDAVIALSVVYKGFENLGGFKKVLNKPAP
ncbi:MAG: hydrogenase/urease accessory protein HupE, partial [Flavobacteriales bacterium]